MCVRFWVTRSEEVDDKKEEEDHKSKMAIMMSNDSPHQDCLVDLSFSEPARFFRCEEHLKKTGFKNIGKAKIEKISFPETLTATRSPLHLANQTSPYLKDSNDDDDDDDDDDDVNMVKHIRKW